MVKRFLILLLIFGKGFGAYSAAGNDSLFRTLKNIIEESPKYDAEKIDPINRLKSSLQSLPKDDLKRQYQITRTLYEEYKTFNYDSAFLYVRKLQEVSHHIQPPAQADFQTGVLVSIQNGMSRALYKYKSRTWKDFYLENYI